MWDYYLCYCEAAFEERHVGVMQMLLMKSQNRFDLLTEFSGEPMSRPENVASFPEELA